MTTMAMIDMAFVAEEVAEHIDRLWPGQSMFGRALALGEEAGEVQRAILKRDHVRVSGHPFKGLDEAGWTDNLRTELAQLIGVALDIAHREGFDMGPAVLEMLDVLRKRSA